VNYFVHECTNFLTLTEAEQRLSLTLSDGSRMEVEDLSQFSGDLNGQTPHYQQLNSEGRTRIRTGGNEISSLETLEQHFANCT